MTNKSQASSTKQIKLKIPSRVLGIGHWNLFIIWILLFGILPMGLFAQSLQGPDAQNVIAGTDLIKFDKYSKLPSFVRFKSENAIAVTSIGKWLEKEMMLPEGNTFSMYLNHADKIGYHHYRYQQRYMGYPVLGGIYIAHAKQGQVLSVNGMAFDLSAVDCNPVLTEQEALNKALEHVGAEIYMWEPKSEGNLSGAKVPYPKGELIIVPVNGNFTAGIFRLAYKFDIFASKPFSNSFVYVEAISGEIIFEEDQILTVDEQGTAICMYSGTQTITADNTGSNYVLRESGTRNIETRDLNRTLASWVPFTDNDNLWNVTTNQDDAAWETHWALEKTWDYYLDTLGWWSYNNFGSQIIAYVHYGFNIVNAFWRSSDASLYLGDGNGSTYTPWTTIDIIGHEVTHGVTRSSANLTMQNESGALSESFSDILGTAIEFYAKPTSADFIIAAELTTNGLGVRNMADPNASNPALGPNPDTYLGDFWWTSPADFGGIHTNCGVQNFWFYLLSQGDSGVNDNDSAYKVKGIGIDKAAQITFRNLTVYLTSFSQYDDARNGSLLAAIDLFDSSSQEYCSVINAWYAVGVGTTQCNKVFTFIPVIETINVKPSIYPNPVHDILTFNIGFKEQSSFKVKVLDVVGRKLYESSAKEIIGNYKVEIDAASWSQGIYFLKITIDGEQHVSKFVKN